MPVNAVPAIVGVAEFLGTWLLVAGPVYQAAVELNEQGERIDQERFEEVSRAVPRPRHIAPTWWLLPPVAYLKQRRAAKRYRDAVMHAMSADQVLQFTHFTDKATGWILVGTGGLLIALGATWGLVETLELPAWAFFPFAAVAFAASASYTAGRMRRSRDLVEQKDPAAAERRRAREARRARR